MKKNKSFTIECPVCAKVLVTWDKTRKTCSWVCRNKRISKMYKGKKFTYEHKMNIKKNHHRVDGEKNPNWRGGISTESNLIRTSSAFKEWRKAVYERDEYKCVRCGSSKSGQLTADHILPFVIYEEYRFDVSNGQTLCRPCHWQKNAEDRAKYFKEGKYVRN